jgi:hypothetical protein
MRRLAGLSGRSEIGETLKDIDRLLQSVDVKGQRELIAFATVRYYFEGLAFTRSYREAIDATAMAGPGFRFPYAVTAWRRWCVIAYCIFWEAAHADSLSQLDYLQPGPLTGLLQRACIQSDAGDVYVLLASEGIARALLDETSASAALSWRS